MGKKADELVGGKAEERVDEKAGSVGVKKSTGTFAGKKSLLLYLSAWILGHQLTTSFLSQTRYPNHAVY